MKRRSRKLETDGASRDLRLETKRREGGLGKNDERAKVAVLFNETEETDQLGLEPIAKLARGDAEASHDAARRAPSSTSRGEAWADAVEARFDYEALGFYDYALRERGEAAPASSRVDWTLRAQPEDSSSSGR